MAIGIATIKSKAQEDEQNHAEMRYPWQSGLRLLADFTIIVILQSRNALSMAIGIATKSYDSATSSRTAEMRYPWQSGLRPTNT